MALAADADDAALRAYYAKRASEYESIYAKPERQADLALLSREVPELLAGQDVLEIACGTGWWTQFIAPRARALTALDASDEVLAIAATKPGVQGVRFVRGDAYDPGAALGRVQPFGAALAAFWWSHVPRSRVAEFLAGLRGVLAPGSPVVLLDNRYVPGSSTPIAGTDGEGNTWQSRKLADGTTYRVLKNFPDRAGLARDLEEPAGDLTWRETRYFWLATFSMR